MEKKVSLSYLAIVGLVLVALLLGCLAGALFGGAAGYGLSRLQGRRVPAVPRIEITPTPPESPGFIPRRPLQSQPYLGVTYEMLTPERAAEEGLNVEEGALILSVEPDSPAAEAGLREGDVITRVDDQGINRDHPLAEVILGYRPGDRVRLTVVRDGQEQVFTVRLGERAPFPLEFPPGRLPLQPEGFPAPRTP